MEILSPEEVNYVIYHNPCSDGVTSAWCAWKYFRENHPDKEIKYHGAHPAHLPPEDITGACVLMCDISFPKRILDWMLKRVKKLYILDHHKSSENELESLPSHMKLFDMTKSGAMLTWEYFFPSTPPPLLIQYVQDKDLWRKKMPDWELFFAWFPTVKCTKEDYDKYSDDNLLLSTMKERGPACAEYADSIIRASSEYARVKLVKVRGYDKTTGLYMVPHLCSSVLKSELGNHLITKYPLADFSAIYSVSDNSNCTAFSLRSTPKNTNVSLFAIKFGGGGHPCASGMELQYITNTIPGVVVSHQEHDIYKELSYIYSGDMIDGKYRVVYTPSKYSGTKLCSWLLQDKYQGHQNASLVLETEDRYDLAVSVLHNVQSSTTQVETRMKVVLSRHLSDLDVEKLTSILGLNQKNVVKYDSIQKQLQVCTSTSS